MGRSKFPGKPSKHVNKKRVNVLPTNGESYNIDEPMTVTEKQHAIPDLGSNEDVPKAPLNTKISLKRRLTKKMQATNAIRNKTSKRNLITKLCSKNGLKTKLNNKIKRSKALTRKCYTNMKNITRTTRESSTLGKFVLPSRSVHSSRVIKPNKRFITVDMNESLSRKQKVIKRHCIGKSDSKASVEVLNEEIDSTVHKISDKSTCTNGKVVLRQARLQFHTQTQSGPEGPFSSATNNGSPPGTVTCGVCGAVRFYRFVKQARKFNIYSCESCRKFISKMIKRQSCGKGIGSTLVCHKGQGMCHVPPIVRSQQWKLIRCAYRARCPACWLKMCLRSFQMPISLKSNLAQLLPVNMQLSDTIFSSASPLFWPSNLKNLVSNKQLQSPVNEKIPKQRPIRNTKIVSRVNCSSTNSDIKRQKVDLKGPRVKHVCRSASIVLGQPLAMFANEIEKKESKEIEPAESKAVESKSVPTESIVPKDKSNVHLKEAKPDPISSESESLENEKVKFPPLNELSINTVRKDRNLKIATNENKLQSDRNRNSTEMQHAISIDFWENYDPDDVSQNGFSLISSEKFPMPSICFLCGSAGREALLHCSVCCEPYHPFCLEQNPLLDNNNSRQFMWLCPRCTMCSSCNQSDRLKINCQKCYKAYHPECFNLGFNTKWSSDDRPTVCSKCLRCKSCGTENITKFVGNLPLCLTCLKLRKKGNFCPLCQKCYDENDFCSKMMECANCNKWVHSKCEGLLEEQYQILSLLPESIEYICKLCSKNTTPYWRKAVDSELKANFNNVLRMLSKNKIARNMLKWSPLNNNTSSSKAITIVKKLQFSDDENTTNIDMHNNNFNNDVDNLCNDSNQMLIDNEPRISVPRTMLDIKSKLNSNEYHSVREYNVEMEEALNLTQSEQVLKIYRSILHTVFPWYESSVIEEPEKFEIIPIEKDFPKINDNVEEYLPPQIDFISNDTRICGFCKGMGDGLGDQESRLLYCGQNEWVHANCALWSSEVYEEIDGSLQHVHSALSRGRSMRCTHCKQKGASVGCCHKSCYETYHFICARNLNCIFLHDKTVFCASHELPKNSHIITSTHDFDIHRSVYVELDKKKGKYCEIEKVNFMVGSLCVTNLGKVNPAISDGYDAIIPTGFVCSRLFWSTVEPWKLVCYNITTDSYNTHMNKVHVDKNFTIDHSLPNTVIERKLKEVNVWHKDMDKKKSDIMDLDDYEEPQNGADLLSPELTDAILKELPHDLLDGISVQDIIPKLMPFEDLVNIDLSNSELIKSDLLEYSQSDGDTKSNRELKRSKSDVILQMSNIDKFAKERCHQRSCSLTLSCKLDRSLSPVVKKRKIVPRENSLYFQLLQVDGNFDDSSSSECGSPTGMGSTISWDILSEEPVTCEKCQCTYRTRASYKKHLDNCELLCTSESDSELMQDQDNTSYQESPLLCTNTYDNTLLLNVGDNMQPQPVVISSFESYQNEIHTSVLNTQTFLTKSSSEVLTVPQNTHDILVSNLPQQLEQKMVPTLSAQCNLPVNSVAPLNIDHTTISEQSFAINQATIPMNESISLPNNASYCVNRTVPLSNYNNPITIQQNTLTPQNSIMNATLQQNMLSVESQNPITVNAQNSLMNAALQQNMITVNSQNSNTLQQNMISMNPQNTIMNGTLQHNQMNSQNILQQNMMSVNPQNSYQQNTLSVNPQNAYQQNTLSVNPQNSYQQNTLSVNPQNTILNGNMLSLNSQNPVLNLNATLHQNNITMNSQSPQNSIVNNMNPITINQVTQSNMPQTIEFQHQPVTIQSVPYNNNINHQPILNVNQNQISLNGKLLSNQNLINSMVTQTVNVPTNQWIKSINKPTVIEKSIKRGRPKTIISKRNMFGDNETILIPSQNASTPSVIVQHLPSTSYVPAFVDTFQQQTGQNLQYIATITPQQLNSTLQSQPLVQLQDNNIISLVPGLQPTMIIQQPRVMENQLVLDSNGTISWAPQPVQPVYYGFETIVQNTVMQSQQFLPTTVPGVLTANSSYSTTTQVFQTSKLEPVLDVSSNSFVLVNPGQLITSQASIEIPQYSQPIKTVANTVLTSNVTKPPQPQPPPIRYSVPRTVEKNISTATINTNSISLPTAPFVQEHGIPTNVVTPTPKPSTSIQNRPMNRVLPMQTATAKEKPLIKINEIHKPDTVLKSGSITEVKKMVSPPVRIETKSVPVENVIPTATEKYAAEPIETKPKIEIILAETKVKTEAPPEKTHVDVKLAEKENNEMVKHDGAASLKIVFQKQSRDGTYKISNNFIPKTTPVQIAPLKPIKSTSAPTITSQTTPLSQNNSFNRSTSSLPKTERKEKRTNVLIPENKQVPVVHDKKTNDSQSIMYTIETQDGFQYSSTSVAELWNKVFETVQNARASHNMPPLSSHSQNIMNSLHVLALKNNGLKYLIEQLPGVEKCSKYKPTHYFPVVQTDLDDEFSIGHTFGSIRCLPYSKKYNNQYDMFGWLSSKHRRPENCLMTDIDVMPRRASVTNLPMAMRFRQLKLTSKYSVGVYRSSIHGRGLFCLRDIEAGEMVIEYAGEVIRSILCDKREKEYNKKGIGCYMFRIDDNLVVDATMKGNAARFINHSCDPNCYSKVVEILGYKHIIIFALRRIIYSEELTYDYKFPFEEDKIPCTCGTRRCRKFLN